MSYPRKSPIRLDLTRGINTLFYGSLTRVGDTLLSFCRQLCALEAKRIQLKMLSVGLEIDTLYSPGYTENYMLDT